MIDLFRQRKVMPGVAAKFFGNSVAVMQREYETVGEWEVLAAADDVFGEATEGSGEE